MALHSTLVQLLQDREELRLPFRPTSLDKADVFFVLLLLVWRSLTGLVTSALGRLVGKASAGAEVTLPRLSISMPFDVDRRDVDAYDLAIGAADERTASILHLGLFLSSVTEPAMLLLLGSRRCPVNPIGAVNVRNRFEIKSLEACQDACGARKGVVQRLSVIATLPESATRVKRGIETAIAVSIIDEDTGRAIFRQIFTVLEFKKHSFASAESDSQRTTTSLNARASSGGAQITVVKDPAAQIHNLKMSARDPYLWAALCKDYNPIHMSTATAKLLGFAGQIAHGNHVVAKAVQTLVQAGTIHDQGPRADSNNGLTFEVEFKRPVAVPGTYEVRTLAEGASLLGMDIVRPGAERHSVVVSIV